MTSTSTSNTSKRLKYRILFQRNGLSEAARNSLMIRVVLAEICEMKDSDRAAEFEKIERDIDICTKEYDDVISELTWKLRERQALLRVRWH
jgi:hypothetical protein